MFSMAKILAVVIFLLLGGCASMNRSECLTADWHLIGLEDGSKGRELSHIGEHRKACAEYRVSPDLEQYQSGYALGLQQYCTYAKGFQLGQRGRSFKNVCTPELKEDYLFGHQRGRAIYTLTQDISRTRSSIKSARELLAELDEEVFHKEELIISDRTSEAERALLLIEIRELEAEIDDLEAEIAMLERHQSAKIHERTKLKQKYQTGPG